jgi:ankyrin repeat protein
MQPLPFDATLDTYQTQAEQLLAGHRAAEPEALEIFHHNHPRFLDEKIPWLPRWLGKGELQNAPLDMDDARLALARWYCFQDWAALKAFVDSVADHEGAVYTFERAVEAVVGGDLAGLRSALEADPELVHRRSTRVTKFDPPVHRAMLLHYVAANGVEGYRQKTPPNAVAITTCLLEAGSEPDALADLYGGPCTTMGLLVSSCHPAEAGLQAALAGVLLDFGAAIEGPSLPKGESPLRTALAFGYLDTAKALVARGARVANVADAAGLGDAAAVAELLPVADADTRHRALALATQHGHTSIVAMLLDAGEDPNRYNPVGNHAHSTPLHQAALDGHEDVVRLLAERGARLDIEDTIYHATPLGWARHAGRRHVEAYLLSKGAT